MKAVVQRVSKSSVSVGSETVGEIGRGLLVLVGVTDGDGAADAVAMADKLAGLRIFRDADGKMNLSVADLGGEILVVSQFTLYGDARRGRRPSFTDAAAPEVAEPLVGVLVERLGSLGIVASTGRFGAMMEVEIHNDGPVTIILQTEDGRFV